MNATVVDQEIARLTKMVDGGKRNRITLWQPESDQELTARYDIPNGSWHVKVTRPKREGAADFGHRGPRVEAEYYLQRYNGQLIEDLAGRLRDEWVLGE